MANQTSTPPQRRWKWLYESLLLNIAEWQREPSHFSSSSSLPPADTTRRLEPVVAKSMGNFETGYAHARLLEEGRGNAESKALLVQGSQAKVYDKDVNKGEEDETIEQAEDEDGDTQDHPNVWMEWKWTVAPKPDTE